MEDWVLISVFHNLSISERIETKYVVIAPYNDPLTQPFRARSVAFSQFIDNFEDQFGNHIAPSLFFLNKKVEPNLEAIISFRNILAISSIVQSWVKYLYYGRQLNYYKFSNYFELYPYSFSKKEERYLIINTPSVVGLNETAKFQGQCSPEIPITSSMNNFYNPILFKALLKEWEKYFVSRKRKDWKYRSLFRSLEMSFRAAELPFQNMATIYDYGTNLALWISSFEILSHPNSENINLSKVLYFLSSISFKTNELNYKIYKGPSNERLNLIQKIYYEMYRARNHFLHGNPVKLSDLFQGQNLKNNSLIEIAPVLYKCALCQFLGLWETDSNRLNENNQDDLGRRILETALLISRKPHRKYRHRKKKN
jgi:hypothetical protein